MLNDREHAALREIERRLRAEDPEFARSMESAQVPPPHQRPAGAHAQPVRAARSVRSARARRGSALAVRLALAGVILRGPRPLPRTETTSRVPVASAEHRTLPAAKTCRGPVAALSLSRHEFV